MARRTHKRSSRPTDEELDGLSFGSIIYGHLRKDGRPVDEPHYGIIISTDKQIENTRRKTNPIYSVVAISSNELISREFLIDVPARAGLTGKIQGEWQTDIAEAGILRIEKAKLTSPEMIKVIELIRRANAAR